MRYGSKTEPIDKKVQWPFPSLGTLPTQEFALTFISFSFFKGSSFCVAKYKSKNFKHYPPRQFNFEQNLNEEVKPNLKDASGVVTWILECSLRAIWL